MVYKREFTIEGQSVIRQSAMDGGLHTGGELENI